MDEYLGQPITEAELRKRKAENNFLRMSFKYILTTAWTLTAATTGAYFFGLSGEKMIPIYIATAAVYFCGRLADQISSRKVADSLSIAQSLDALDDYDFVETSPRYRDHAKKEDFASHRKNIFDYAYVLPALSFPPYGIYRGISSYLASSHNNLINDWLQWQIQKNETKRIKHY